MTIKIDQIRIDGGTQSRAAINLDVVAEYADAVGAGTEFPPVIVFFDGSSYWLADGFHRYEAYAKSGADYLPADVRQGSRRDAVLFSVGANASHGLRRTNDDKRRAVMVLLSDPEWSNWTDREIARQAGVHYNFVGKMRKGVTITRSDSEPRTYTTKHGTVAQMDTAKIGKPSADVQENRYPDFASWEDPEQTQEIEAVSYSEPDPHAKLRAEFRAMTDEGREEDWIGLRIETDELRKRVKNQTSQIADLKQAVQQLGEGSDMGKALSAKIRELGAVKLARDEALRAAKRMEYRLKQAEEKNA